MTYELGIAGSFMECIDSNLLIAYGAVFKKYDKGAYIFREGQDAHFYHQVAEGRVKLVNVNEEGKEFIQGFVTEGESFGVSSIFDKVPYTTDALAERISIVLRLCISAFVQMLKDNFEVQMSVAKSLSCKLANKENLLKEIACNNPEERILSLLKKYRQERFPLLKNSIRAKVDFTRKDIAEMSGLRVETVIRIMRHLQDQRLLTIERGKVYF